MVHPCFSGSYLGALFFIYQENNSTQYNAGISIINSEAHIVLSGNLIGLLTKEEMKVLLAHELSHYLFYKIENEEFEIVQRIILALANDTRSEDAIIETARIFQLYLELFCDAGSLEVCGDYKVIMVFAKRARGAMARYIVQNNISDPEQIKLFDTDGYSFDVNQSTEDNWVFVR